MKIVFNTREPNEAASLFFANAIRGLPSVTIGDFNHYESYDVALFMQHAPDLPEIEKARSANPRLKIGIVDPRGARLLPYLAKVDFALVNSLEKKDYFVGTQPNIHIYYEYPEFPKQAKLHAPKETIIIGYHGNKVHLASIFPRISAALEQLASKHSIEFWAIYNVRDLGEWKSGLPRNLKVRHIQWDESCYENELSKVDIGIVPNFMPIRSEAKLKRRAVFSERYFLDRDEDYFVRYKVPSNPGRIIVFARLGIPVVADMYPSAVDFIREGQSGFLAYSSGAWAAALERLIVDHELRNEFAKNLDRELEEKTGFKHQNERLIKFLEKVVQEPTPSKNSEIKSTRKPADLAFRAQVLFESHIEPTRRRVVRKLNKLRGSP